MLHIDVKDVDSNTDADILFVENIDDVIRYFNSEWYTGEDVKVVWKFIGRGLSGVLKSFSVYCDNKLRELGEEIIPADAQTKIEEYI
jgi:hypothetical protein